MRALYFDCFSGISGDMTLGALLDLGIDPDLFRRELNKLNLAEFEIRIVPKIQKGIAGTDVAVILTTEPVLPAPALQGAPEHGHDHPEEGDHAHSHDGHIHHHDQQPDHHHGHEHSPQSGQAHHPSERNLGDIEGIIDRSDLSRTVKDFSKKVFREIAAAEAKVHQKAIREVHFHEVGAVDSIVDIVGTAICLELLGVERVYSSALHDGSGTIACRHGIIPVPVPAVMEMLSGSGIPFITEDVGTELVTPTGMGLIKCLAVEYGAMPPLRVTKAGYGMGKRETGRLNALRIVLGDLWDAPGAPRENVPEIVVLETNIDDMSPEILGYTAEKLMQQGARDVFYAPVYMKKNRPAYLLTVLADQAKEAALVAIILRETSTFGIRRSVVQRYCMDREIVRVAAAGGEVRVKIGFKDGIRKAAPEYEDCKALADQTGLPLRTVYEMALAAAGKQPG